jgi:diguanylate cyclase (GGDEF)-like protein/PAS domain S-box-containing protein
MKSSEHRSTTHAMRTAESSLDTLIESPQFAWSVLESLPTEAVLVFDRDLRIVAAAGQVLRERDFAPERVVGSLLSEAIPEEAYPRYEPHYKSALAGETSSLEAETLDGRNIFANTFTPLRDDDGEVVGGVVFTRDVTDARRARAALAASEEHFRELVEDATDMISRLDPDGTIRYASQASEALFGYTPDDLAGRPIFEFVHPEDLPKLEEVHGCLKTQTDPVTVSYRLRRSDGTYAFVESTVRPRRDASGSLVDLRVLTRDVGEHQAAEELRRRFEAAFADAPIGMALVDLDGRFMRVNHSLCEITGYPEERMLELTFQEITHPDDLDADLAYLEQLHGGEIERYSMEKRYHTAGHNLIWVNLSVSMVRDADGEPLHYVSQIEDISDRKRLEAQLHWLADHDSLTKLWNRRRFDEELRRQISRCQRYAERAALLLLDLDDFKPVNDRYGHKVGDDLLIEIAAALQSRLRDTDAVARIGGDEFAVLAVNVSPDQAEALVVALGDVVAETEINVEGKSVGVGVSVGLAVIDEQPEHQQDLFVRADKAMYRAKARKAGSDLARS